VRAEQIAAIREGLAGLADEVPCWRATLRVLHLDAGLIEEDWIERHCPAEIVQEHHRYLREFWHEVLVTGAPSKIVYGDEPCRSSYLSALKRQRFERYGPSQPLFDVPQTRHLVELSRGNQYLSRIDERSTDEDLALFRARLRMAGERLEAGAQHHAAAIATLRGRLTALMKNEIEIAESLAEHLSAQLWPLEASVTPYRLLNQKTESRAVRWPCGGNVQLVAACVVDASTEHSRSVAIGWRLRSEGKDDVSSERGGALHLDELVPMHRYTNFDDAEGLAFSFVAFGELAKLMVPSLCSRIGDAVRANQDLFDAGA